MLCRLKRVIYPKNHATYNVSGYTVVEYTVVEDTKESVHPLKKGDTFSAVGNFIPTAPITYEVSGQWSKGKYGVQLVIDNVKETQLNNKDDIISYLSCGLIKGIGKKTAELIYNYYGENSLKVIEENPQKLIAIKGISPSKAQKIGESYNKNKSIALLTGYLVPLGISIGICQKIYRAYKEDALNIAKSRPFDLCDISGVSYDTAATIADYQCLPKDAPDRCRAALMYVLQINEFAGNLYMEIANWMTETQKLLKGCDVPEPALRDHAKALISEGKVKYSVSPEDRHLNAVYRMEAAKAENNVANKITKLIRNKLVVNFDIADAVDEYEEERQFKFAPEQRAAIEKSLSERVSVITGGPGTGKTTIIDAIYNIFKKKNPSKSVLMCAPTGCAARRITESTGISACTIHKALDLRPSDDEDIHTVTQIELDVGLVIVDEFSMADMYLASNLFNALSDDTQIMLIGDVDQLPSVGPGAVLSEIIESGCVAVTQLKKIYRQKNNSKVALNAALIREGRTDLVFDSDSDQSSFVFYETNSLDEASQMMKEVYLRETGISGIDGVVLLTPFKRKTIICSNEFNKNIHNLINPPNSLKKECTVNGTIFRVGDKVIQTRNTEFVSNGDIGYIESISALDEQMTIDFNSTKITCSFDSLDSLEHAYAISVHKSQGSEYDTVILNIMNAHNIMLRRNLIYTGITRAKRKIIIIGQKTAVEKAILTSSEDKKRKTLLAVRLRYAQRAISSSTTKKESISA